MDGGFVFMVCGRWRGGVLHENTYTTKELYIVEFWLS